MPTRLGIHSKYMYLSAIEVFSYIIFNMSLCYNAYVQVIQNGSVDSESVNITKYICS